MKRKGQGQQVKVENNSFCKLRGDKGGAVRKARMYGTAWDVQAREQKGGPHQQGVLGARGASCEQETLCALE